jgi:hypothetical protein
MTLEEMLTQFLDRAYVSGDGYVRVTFDRDGELHPYEAQIEHITRGPEHGHVPPPDRYWGHGDTPSRALQNAIEEWDQR